MVSKRSRRQTRKQRGGDVATMLDSRLSNSNYIIPAGTLISRPSRQRREGGRFRSDLLSESRPTPRLEPAAPVSMRRRTTPPFARKRKTRGRSSSRSRQTKRI